MFTEYSEGMAANEFERRIERMRLQQEIACLEQEELTLQRGFCPFSGNVRVEECANHSDHLRQLQTRHATLQRLRKEDRKYNIA